MNAGYDPAALTAEVPAREAESRGRAGELLGAWVDEIAAASAARDGNGR